MQQAESLYRDGKQLLILAEGSNESEFGTALYLAALTGDVKRQFYYLDAMAPGASDSTMPPRGAGEAWSDGLTRLGRTTDFAQTDSGTETPCGQRMLVIGEDEVPLLAIRSIEFDPPAESGMRSDG